MKSIFLFAIVLLFASPAFAQHKIEVTGDYSYFRLNPGLPTTFNSHSLNGGGGDVTFFLTDALALKADLQGYGSFTECTKTIPQACANGNLFTYMFGPEFKLRAGKLEPFGEVLVGGAHSNLYGNICNQITGFCSTTKSPSNNAFAFEAGGGLDIAVSRKFAIRLVDADYVLTRFGNNFTGGNNSQSNFRFQTGVQIRF
jgi:opacity protein-like surface antigen